MKCLFVVGLINFRQPQWGTIQSSEKRGAMRFYYLIVDGVKLPQKLDGSVIRYDSLLKKLKLIRRKYTPSEKEVRIILENIAEKEPGKPWKVRISYEFCTKVLFR